MSRTYRSTSLTLTSLTVVTLALLAACEQGTRAPAEPASERVENPELGVAVAALPGTFRVAGMESNRITLELIEGQGQMEIFAGEAETSINLVAAVEGHKEAINARSGGDYKGGNELVLPAMPGAAYYSRGRYEGDAGPTEEVMVFMIHPWKDRQLRVIYTYPAGEDSKERLENELFAVVGELEGLPAPGAAGASGAEAPGV